MRVNRRTASRATVLAAALALAAAACGDGGEGGAGAGATVFAHIHGIAVHPGQSNVLYVATHGGLITGVNDSGWAYASDDRNDYMGFTVDPASATLFRSGHPEAGGTLGVESSTDGRDWERLADVLSPPADFHAMTVSFADPRTLYGWDSGGRGLFRSTDAGTRWTRLSPRGLPLPVLALGGPAEPNAVYAGTPRGLFRSDDGGAAWAPVTGLPSVPVAAIGCDPKDPAHLVASTERATLVSRDGGDSWTPASGIPAGELVFAFAISPHDGGVAYAAGVTTIYKSTDGGETWMLVRSGA